MPGDHAAVARERVVDGEADLDQERAALLRNAYLHYRVNRNESSVKSDAKVFEVCGEYAMSNEFLHEDPQRLKDFGACLQVAKFGTYRWNYNRISADYQEAFAERWAQEYREADAEGLLDESMFEAKDWALIQELLADPVAFAATHPEFA